MDATPCTTPPVVIPAGFTRAAGRWSQQAQTTRWEDAGAYTFPQQDVLRLTGMFGPSEWKRLAAPPYFDTDEINGQPIPKYVPLVVMQNLIEVARPWRADAVPVMLQIERWKHGEFQLHVRYASPMQRNGLSVMLFKHERRTHEYAAVTWNLSPMPPKFVDLPKVVEIAAREGRPPPYKRFRFEISDQKRWGWGVIGERQTDWFNFFAISPSGEVERSTEPSEYIKWYNEQWDRTIDLWRQLFARGRGVACDPNTDKNKCQWGHAYWRTLCERSGPGTGVGSYDPGTMRCR